MTRAQKLEVHLEMVMWKTVPLGTRMNAQQVQALMAQATSEQKQAAYERALVHNPLLLDDERAGGYDPAGGADV